MSTLIEIDPALLESLDFDLACDQCETSAIWSCKCLRCSQQGFVCDTCKEEILSYDEVPCRGEVVNPQNYIWVKL